LNNSLNGVLMWFFKRIFRSKRADEAYHYAMLALNGLSQVQSRITDLDRKLDSLVLKIHDKIGDLMSDISKLYMEIDRLEREIKRLDSIIKIITRHYIEGAESRARRGE